MTRQPFEIPMPFDAHLHLRQNGVAFSPPQPGTRPNKIMNLLDEVLPYTARQFWGGVAMTNTRPPAVTYGVVRLYEADIREASKRVHKPFHPIAPLFLTKETRPADVLEDGIVAVKFMPEGGTTNAMSGLPGLEPSAYPVFEAMQQKGVRLLVHGEVTDPHLKSRDLEPVFLARELLPVLVAFPKLIVHIEHMTTKASVDFIREYGARYNLKGTITPQHLNEDYDSLTRKNGKNGLWREKYCLPTYKTDADRLALLGFAMTDHRAFAGTDSAPHIERSKEARGCCAGAFTAPCAMEMYAKAFEETDAADWEKRLAQFASERGPRAYGLEPSKRILRFEPKAWTVAESIPVTVLTGMAEIVSPNDEQSIVPYMAGETLAWKALEKT